MDKIITLKQLPKLKQLKTGDKTLVLVGGCFDILHAAHKEFLENAKKQGDLLMIILESDDKVKELKGKKRPINSQKKRAEALAKFSSVDMVLMTPFLKNDHDYEILVKKLEPDIIAITRGAPLYSWEKDYMTEKRGKIVEVINRKKDYSTSKIVENRLNI